MQSKTTAGRKRHNVKKAPGIYNKLDRHGNRRYEIAYRDSDGRLRFKVVPGNLEAAKAARAAIVDRKARGERVVPTTATFEEYADGWFEGLTLRAETIELYRGTYKRHLLPVFGSRRLAEITVDDVAP
jgi:Phage integrase, N-terminal SAM-like domain